MFFSEYLINSTEFILYDHNDNRIHDLEFLSEVIQPQPVPVQQQPKINKMQQQPDFGQFDPGPPEPQLNPSAEFENIKLYILYSRFKEFRQYLQDLNMSIQNPEIDSVIEFLDIILLYYTTFSYSDLTTFLDSITLSLEEKLKIKLPKRVYSDPAVDG